MRRFLGSPSNSPKSVRLLIRGIRMDIVSHPDIDDKSHYLGRGNHPRRMRSSRVGVGRQTAAEVVLQFGCMQVCRIALSR